MSDYDAASSRTTAGANKQAFIYGLLGGLVAIAIAVFIMVQVGMLSVPGNTAVLAQDKQRQEIKDAIFKECMRVHKNDYFACSR